MEGLLSTGPTPSSLLQNTEYFQYHHLLQISAQLSSPGKSGLEGNIFMSKFGPEMESKDHTGPVVLAFHSFNNLLSDVYSPQSRVSL